MAGRVMKEEIVPSLGAFNKLATDIIKGWLCWFSTSPKEIIEFVEQSWNVFDTALHNKYADETLSAFPTSSSTKFGVQPVASEIPVYEQCVCGIYIA